MLPTGFHTGLGGGGGGGGGEQDGTRMTVAHESTLTYVHVPTRRIGKHAPPGKC